MKRRGLSFLAVLFLSLTLFLPAQGTRADYERAAGLQKKLEYLTEGVVDRSAWIGDTSRFWYRKTVKGGVEFVVMDAESLTKKPAFDHQKLAASLSAASGEIFSALRLPFMALTFVSDGKALEFEAGDSRWRCELADYTVKKLGPAARSAGGSPFTPRTAPPQEPKVSPDGKKEAFIRNFNVWLRSNDTKKETPLSWEGNEGDYYVLSSVRWSPDSKKLAAYRLRPGYQRIVHYVESSPADQLQPKYYTYDYPKPGDVMDLCRPVLFQIETGKQVIVDNALFPDPYHQQGVGPNSRDIPDALWRKDSRAYTFEYNQRGHQVYRVIEVDAATGKPRALINEESKTFFSYSGKKYRFNTQDGKEIIWMSERDGWNHLYLYDAETGTVKNQITKGEWVVRGVDKVDEATRQIWFQASGMYPGQDPYFIHYYRINFDGTGLTPLTEGDGNHAVAFSSDRKYYVDTWSRVDLPPVCELRRTERPEGSRARSKRRISQELLKAGWRAPEVFVSKGRDGKTDIWGIIFRPTNFDPKKKYPVIEYIYAGPHDSFVPKPSAPSTRCSPWPNSVSSSCRSTAWAPPTGPRPFTTSAGRTSATPDSPTGSSGTRPSPPNIPTYDITRVGIYGGSAGGQNSTGALLFHPEFYKVAVSFAGCHDNRMDKIWWNEQWMGCPVGPEYAASSNVDNAYRLQGKLLLIVGELDTNVDPASTMQVVNALIKANKDFDLLVIPGG